MIVNPGIRRFLGSAIQRLFNSASFYAPLTHSLVLERGTGSPSFTRATTATVTNNDGYLVTALSGEARFEGARRVRNLQATSSEPTSGWTAAGATPPTVTYTTLDGSGAVSMAFPVVAAGYANSRCSGPINSVSWVQNSTKIATQMVVSLSRALTGSEALTLYLAGASALDDVIVFNASNSPTSAVLQSVVDTFVNPTFSGTMGVTVYVSGAIVGSPVTLSLTRIQFEDVTAQTTQTAGEYVSVGALDYRSDLNPLYLSLPGTNGHCATTPDSVSTSPTGDIELIFDGAATDWTPTADQVLICKDDAGIQRDILLFLRLATARVELWTSATGASYAGRAASATAALPFADGQRGQIKVTRSAATGDTNFYTSTDGSTWTQLGTTVSTTAGAIHDGTAALTIGALGDASKTIAFGGKVYSATLASSIGGAPVVDFNPHRDAVTPTGTFTSSTTGEVWTINGASSVIRSDYYHGSFVDGVKCYATDINGSPIPSSTLLGYQAQGARTNLCLQSQSFDTTWTATALTTISSTRTAPDGTATAFEFDDGVSGGTSHRRFQSPVNTTAVPHTMSVYAKDVDRGWIGFRLTDSGGVNRLCWFNIAAGVVGTAAAGFTTSIQSLPNGWYRCIATLTTFAGDSTPLLFLAPSDGVDVYVGSNKKAQLWGAQVELGSFATPYIPTTTIAVARNADVDQYPTTAGPIAAAGSIALDFTPYHAPSGTIALWGTYVDASNYTAILHDATNLIFRKRIAGSNYDATIANAFVSGTTYKVAATWGAAGTAIYLDGVAGTPHANTTAAQIAATMQVGADGNSLQQPGAGTTNLRIWQRQLSAPEGVAVTS